MGKQRKADLWLLLIAFLWGFSYYFTDLALTELQPCTLNAIRFLLAFVLLGAVFFKRLRHCNRTTLRYAVALGLCLVGAYTGATYGLLYTSQTNAAFISCLEVIFTPIFSVLFLRRAPRKKLALCVLLCALGLALLTLGKNFQVAKGDLICLICSISYAVDLLITEKAVADPRTDPLALGVLQQGVTGLIMLLLAFLLETPRLPTGGSVWLSVVFLGIFCTGLSFVIQSVQQQYTSAMHCGLILTMEPVFAAIAAFFLAGERLGLRNYLGALLMLASLILMELGGAEKEDLRE